jgi:hypothetical protein
LRCFESNYSIRKLKKLLTYNWDVLNKLEKMLTYNWDVLSRIGPFEEALCRWGDPIQKSQRPSQCRAHHLKIIIKQYFKRNLLLSHTNWNLCNIENVLMSEYPTKILWRMGGGGGAVSVSHWNLPFLVLKHEYHKFYLSKHYKSQLNFN